MNNQTAHALRTIATIRGGKRSRWHYQKLKAKYRSQPNSRKYLMAEAKRLEEMWLRAVERKAIADAHAEAERKRIAAMPRPTIEAAPIVQTEEPKPRTLIWRLLNWLRKLVGRWHTQK